MEIVIVIVNIVVFLVCMFLCRNSLFVSVFYGLTFIFCYSRYVISILDESYILGGEEWVFSGVNNIAIENYSYFFLLFQCVCFFVFLLSRNREEMKYEVKDFAIFNFILYFLILFLFYKAYLLSLAFVEYGYLGVVDYKFPTWLSIITSSLSKPFILMLLLLYAFSVKKNYLYIAIFLIFLITLSGQRKDLVSILLFFFCYFFADSKKKYIKLSIALCVLFGVSLLIFWLREESFSLSSDFIYQMFWGLGISINPGFYVVENYDKFDSLDSLGFPVTYFYCGIGKIFSNVCFDSVRLQYPGFLLEKISSFQNFDFDTVFGGLGGNLLASLVVAAGYEGQIDFSFISFYLMLTTLFTLGVVIALTSIKITVTSALLITHILISSRYAFDGIFPAANQLIVAVLLDYFVLRSKKLIR